jgi:hypothetical protein
MKSKIFIPLLLDLQLFAEGGAGASGASGGDGGTGAGGTTGATSTAAVSSKLSKAAKNPLADVKYGVQREDTTPVAEVKPQETAMPVTETVNREAEFEKLIKGEYKDLYDARMQDTIQKRLKSSKEVVDKYNALTPTLEALAKKYGVDASDSEALNRAIEEDDSYYEQEALERGITVQQLKEIRKMERENEALRKQMDEKDRRDKAAQDYARWTEQANKARLTYPSLDLNVEAKNPQFLRLLNSGVDVGTAYAVIHKDEIIPAAMQYAAKVVEEKTVNNIIAGGARPVENGISSQSASLTKSDVSQLTKNDRAEIMRRVARGEKITFS